VVVVGVVVLGVGVVTVPVPDPPVVVDALDRVEGDEAFVAVAVFAGLVVPDVPVFPAAAAFEC
jgi:hypothetical protein